MMRYFLIVQRKSICLPAENKINQNKNQLIMKKLKINPRNLKKLAEWTIRIFYWGVAVMLLSGIILTLKLLGKSIAYSDWEVFLYAGIMFLILLGGIRYHKEIFRKIFE